LVTMLSQYKGMCVLSGSPRKSGPVELRVRKKFALLFCETKGLDEYIIKPGCSVNLVVFCFRHTPKWLQSSEGRFKGHVTPPPNFLFAKTNLLAIRSIWAKKNLNLVESSIFYALSKSRLKCYATAF